MFLVYFVLTTLKYIYVLDEFRTASEGGDYDKADMYYKEFPPSPKAIIRNEFNKWYYRSSDILLTSFVYRNADTGHNISNNKKSLIIRIARDFPLLTKDGVYLLWKILCDCDLHRDKTLFLSNHLDVSKTLFAALKEI
ncbi:MAG: hypothetical protein AAF485_29580, partial [Chloroflexota bacterium]